MKRKLNEIDSSTGKRQRLKSIKRSRSPSPYYNQGGASDDETDDCRVIKKMINSLKVSVVTRRCIPFQKIDRSNVPSYIN
jgi:hypothetical protein